MFAYFRLYVGSLDVEVEWLVGPIPISDGIGKEIIAKYSAQVESNGEFYTDSNGRQMLKRKRDYRPTWKLNVTEPVSGNYYPINSRMFIKDEHQQVCLFYDCQARCLKITEKVSFNIASEASYVYISGGQKLTKNTKKDHFENLMLFE